MNPDTIASALAEFCAALAATGDAHKAMGRALYVTMQGHALNRIGVDVCGAHLTVEWDADYEDAMSVRVRPGDDLSELIAGYAPSLLVAIEDEAEKHMAAEREEAREWLQQLTRKD